MQKLIHKLNDLAMAYEDSAIKEPDDIQRAWLRGLALGLRRTILELKRSKMNCHFCNKSAVNKVPKIDRWYKTIPVWYWVWLCNACIKGR